MDNVNVLRTGFFALDFSLPDTEGNIYHLEENLSGSFTCLCFFTDGENDRINTFLKDLAQGLPQTRSGLPVKIIGICPERSSHLKALKEKLKLNFALLSDQKLDIAGKYLVINSSLPKPSVYFSVFIVDDMGVIRHRSSEVSGFSKYVPEGLRAEISKLI
jgi:peroxiredoxin